MSKQESGGITECRCFGKHYYNSASGRKPDEDKKTYEKANFHLLLPDSSFEYLQKDSNKKEIDIDYTDREGWQTIKGLSIKIHRSISYVRETSSPKS